MMRTLFLYRRALAWGAYAGLLLGSRALVEANMWQHMLLQFPALITGGVWLGHALPARWAVASARYNQLGLTGLVYAAVATSVWMIPRAIDLAVEDWRIDAIKIASLLLTGIALRLSWKAAGRTLQAFFLVSWAMMTVTVGMLYQDSTSRLCSSYLTNDQVWAGYGLVAISGLLVAGWFARVLREFVLTGDATLPKW